MGGLPHWVQSNRLSMSPCIKELAHLFTSKTFHYFGLDGHYEPIVLCDPWFVFASLLMSVFEYLSNLLIAHLILDPCPLIRKVPIRSLLCLVNYLVSWLVS